MLLLLLPSSVNVTVNSQGVRVYPDSLSLQDAPASVLAVGILPDETACHRGSQNQYQTEPETEPRLDHETSQAQGWFDMHCSRIIS